MSPVVKRAREQGARANGGADQHWSMLLFESFSAGVMAVFLLFALVMLAVGIYALLVWPLTFWDLTSLGLEKYGSWVRLVLWSVFAGGSLAGFWCFSGAAFRTKSRAANVATRAKGLLKK